MRPQSARASRRLLRDHRGEHAGLAPLVVNRKGVYTDLAKWAKRGHTRLRVDGEFVKVDRGRGWTASRGTRWSCLSAISW